MKQAYQLLKKYFGYDFFRPLQEEVVQSLANNKDVLLLMPTGGGKSICYQLPALMRDGLTIVISPLIALMKDQVESLRANGVAAAFLNSSLDYANEIAIHNQCRQEQLSLLYVSPERALSLKDSLFSSIKVSLIAIDEAHCISSWGHDFRPEYQQIHFLRDVFPNAPVIALTATADKITRRDIITQIRLKNPDIYISSFDRPNLKLTIRPNIPEKSKIHEIEELIRQHPNDSGIIYCLSRKSTEDVAAKLTERNINAAYYHAGMDTSERNKVQEGFIKDDIQVICATIAFGMGIDKSNVRYVVHFNLPRNIEGYYQEIGRAGRDGLPSDTILYFGIKDLFMLRKFALESGQPDLNLEKLRQMQQYAEATICRRKILLNYFSETMTHDCGNCDVCLNPPKYFDGALIAQKALSALSRVNESVGFTMLINILRGSRNADLLDKGYDKIKTYGAGKDISFDVWQYYLMQMQQLGLLEIAYDENYALKITPFGKQILQGQRSIFFANKSEFLPEKEFSQPAIHQEDAQYASVLFEELRKLRRLIADSEALPAFQVFSDLTLKAMVKELPVTSVEMGNIPGVSQKKLERYGKEFIKVIDEFITINSIIRKEGLESLLSDMNIRKYIAEMKKYKVRVSHHLLSKILLGSEQATLTLTEQHLSFYGKLKNITKHKTLSPLLKSYFEKHIYTKENDAVEQHFNSPMYNELNKKAIELFKNVINSIPLTRPTETITNENLIELRKTYPRSHEPWSDEEIDIFKGLIRKTNDLELLVTIFQRSPNSIKAAYGNLLKQEAIDAVELS